MSLISALKDSVLSAFSTSISLGDILISLVVSAAIAVLIIFVYKKTFSGVVYSRSTTLTLLLLTLATSLIIRTINSNLSLSLGMVGALSIVRFRTAIKDPSDTAFLFWAVTAGIMSGAGLYLIAIVGSLGVALIYYIAYLVGVKSKKQYLLIISCSDDAQNAVKKALSSVKTVLKSKSLRQGGAELTYQVVYDEKLDDLMSDIKALPGVNYVNLVAYTNDFGM